MPGSSSAAPATAGRSGACGARRRSGGGFCDLPPMPGKRRCRKHGGAPGIGAPKGNRNAVKHGAYTAASRARAKAMRDYVRASQSFMHACDAGARSAALIRRYAAIERVADHLATTTQRLLGE